MAIRALYTVCRGATATLFVEAVTGDPSIASTPVCKIKPISAPAAPIPDSSVAAVLTVTPVLTGAAPPIGSGWSITITAAQSAELLAGFYIADFAFVVAGAWITTAPVVLEVVNASSVP